MSDRSNASNVRYLCRVVCHCRKCEEKSDGMTIVERAQCDRVYRVTARKHIKNHRHDQCPRDYTRVDDVEGYIEDIDLLCCSVGVSNAVRTDISISLFVL